MFLEYTIPKQYKVSTNDIYAGMHYRKRIPYVKFYHDIVYTNVLEMLKGEDLQTPIDLHFYFYWKSRILDSSNCSFIGKCLEDGLTDIYKRDKITKKRYLYRKGILRDDSPKYVRNVTYTSVLIEKKERNKMTGDRVEIHIIERDCQE